MTKFTIAEKARAVELVKEGSSLAGASRETGISVQVIRNVLNHTEQGGWEELTRHRYDWTGGEKLAILRHMEANHLSTAETSIQFGIKGAAARVTAHLTLCSWLCYNFICYPAAWRLFVGIIDSAQQDLFV